MRQVLTNQYVREMNMTELNYIQYGRFLERNNIKNNDDSDNYVRFLKEEYEDKFKYQEIKESDVEYNSTLTDRDIEYTDFLCFLSEHGKDNWDNELVVIKSEEYDRFYKSEVENDEMQMIMIEPDNFFKDFQEISGIDNFDKDFVSAKYIDEQENSINLMVNIKGRNERYIIDVV